MARRSNYPNVQEVETKSGEMSEMISHAIAIQDIGKTGTPKTPEEWENRIRQYFLYCTENDIRPGVEGMALACGTSRQNLWDRQKRGGKVGSIIDSAKQVLASLLETWCLEGRLNPATGIFLMKNHYGYSDVQRLEVEPKNPLGEEISMEEIAARIPDDIANEGIPGNISECIPEFDD